MMRWIGVLSWSRTLPRDLRLLFFSLFLWTFGLGIYNYVWSLYLTQLNANPEQVGLVSSIGFFAAAISMVPGGILANKYDNRTLLIIGWAMSIPVPILFYFSRTWSDVIPGLIILQLSAFNVPAMNAFISALGDQKRMSSAFGAVYSAFPLGLVLSPAVGSLLLTWLSIRDLFWFTLALWTVYYHPLPAKASATEGSGFEGSIVGATKVFTRANDSCIPFRRSSSLQHYLTIIPSIIPSRSASSHRCSDLASRNCPVSG